MQCKRFVLDEQMSKLVCDLSLMSGQFFARGYDHSFGFVEDWRHHARAPFPKVWIEYDNHALVRRQLEYMPQPQSGDVLSREPRWSGVLLERHPDFETVCRMTIVKGTINARFANVVVFPFALMWNSIDEPLPWPSVSLTGSPHIVQAARSLRKLAGCPDPWNETDAMIWSLTNVAGVAIGGLLYETPYIKLTPSPYSINSHDHEYGELAFKTKGGELRHIFALLSTLNDLPTQERDVQHPGVFIDIRGKRQPFLEHREVSIKVPTHRSLRSLAIRALTAIHRRRHEVRGHWRTLHRGKPEERKVWIKEHERGDASLGRITYDYRVMIE
jgi:hypothetical protein